MRAEYVSEIEFSENSFFNPKIGGIYLDPRGFNGKSELTTLEDTYPFQLSQKDFVWIVNGLEIQPFY